MARRIRRDGTDEDVSLDQFSSATACVCGLESACPSTVRFSKGEVLIDSLW